MSKVIFTGDIHIRDYLKYGKYKNHRLDQFVMLAQHMNSSIQEYGASHLIIAGDLLDKAKCSPIELHTLCAFFDTLIEGNNCQILITHGNHDTDSRFQINNDCVYYPILIQNYTNIRYVHNEMVNIGGKQFYFRGWEKEGIKKVPPCDVFVGHYCLPTSINRHGLIFPGEPNRFETVNDLVILGDIHKYQIIDGEGCKICIPGAPMQNSFSDAPDCGYCITEIDNLAKITRISTANTEWVLKFYYEDDFDCKRYHLEWESQRNEGTTDLDFDKWLFEEHNIVYKSKPLESKINILETEFIKDLSLNDTLESLVQDFPYKDELLTAVGEHSQPLDSIINLELKADLKTIELTNFKTIEHLSLNFEAIKPFSIITGLNGAGKTTFLQGLIWCLTGESPTGADDVIMHGSKYCEAKLKIEYQSKLISIERSRGSKFDFTVKIDGIPVDGSSKSDLQNRLEEILPLIKRVHLLYYNQSRDGLLAELSDSDRVSLISELTGLNLITDISNNVEEKVVSLKEEANQAEQQYNSLASKLEGLKSVYIPDLEDPTSALQAARERLCEIEEKRGDLFKQKTKIADEYKRVRSLKYNERDTYTSTIRTKYDLVSSETFAKLAALRDKVRDLSAKMREIDSQISQKKNIANKKISWACDKCGTVFAPKDTTQDAINKAVAEIQDLGLEKSTISNKIDKLNALYVRVTEDIEIKKSEMQREIESATSIINEDLNNLDKEECAKTQSIDLELDNLVKLEQEVRPELDVLLQRKGQYERNVEILNQIKSLSVKVNNEQTTSNEKSTKYTAFNQIYKKVFGSDGLLAATVLQKLAAEINTDENIRIVTTKVLKNKSVCPTLDIEMRCIDTGHWTPYKSLSGGEKLYADLYFLSKLVAAVQGISFLLLDEVLKYADTEVIIKMFDLLAKMSVKHIFLIYHGDIPQELIEEDIATRIHVRKINGHSTYQTLS